MRAVRTILSTLVVFVLLQTGCSKKPSDQNANAPAPDGAAQQGALEAPTNGDARAHFDRGMDAYRGNRDEEAVEAFRQAAQLDPDFAEAHYRLGLALNAAGQSEESDKSFEQAIKSYEKLTKQAPKDANAFYFMGLSYEKLGKYDEAVRVLKEAVRNSPDEDDDKYYELAFAHFKVAQYDESVKALNKALEINPDNYPAADLLVKAKDGASRVSEIRKHQEALRKKNANGNVNGNSNGGANSNGRTNSNGGGANKNSMISPTI
ncbi:MAG: tetratricopeptide repeat protein [Rubrivivax sp.]|nr:tetratricopeptide repeat protein [Pyrinomonadaceae bacterium]